MRFPEGFKVVNMAYKQRDKEKWLVIWAAVQPNDGTHLIGFDAWYDGMLKKSKSVKKANAMSDEDILNESKRIRENKERMAKR